MLRALASPLCLGALVGTTSVGNALVCLSVCLVRRLRHPSNYLLASLAASNLCVTLLVMPIALYLELNNKRWDLGRATCDAWIFIDVASYSALVLNLCMVSFDCYLAITRPHTYGVKRTAHRSWACIAAVWLLAALTTAPPFLVFGSEHGTSEMPTCLILHHPDYKIYASLAAFYIPLGVMIFMYWRAHRAAKKVFEAEHGANPWLRSRSLRIIVRERNASITLGIILTAFTVCWLPFFAIALVRPLGATPIPDVAHRFTLWLGYANSALNPIIFLTSNHHFRRAIRDLLLLQYHEQSRGNRPTNDKSSSGAGRELV